MAFDKLKKMLGDEDDFRESNEEEYYSVEANEGIKGDSNQMILVEPRAYSESQTIADHLKARNTVIVNLRRVTAAQGKRIIDFLTGTLYDIGGDMQKIGQGNYLCTPKDVKVQGKITDDSEEKSGKKDEDVDW